MMEAVRANQARSPFAGERDSSSRLLSRPAVPCGDGSPPRATRPRRPSALRSSEHRDTTSQSRRSSKREIQIPRASAEAIARHSAPCFRGHRLACGRYGAISRRGFMLIFRNKSGTCCRANCRCNAKSTNTAQKGLAAIEAPFARPETALWDAAAAVRPLEEAPRCSTDRAQG